LQGAVHSQEGRELEALKKTRVKLGVDSTN